MSVYLEIERIACSEWWYHQPWDFSHPMITCSNVLYIKPSSLFFKKHYTYSVENLEQTQTIYLPFVFNKYKLIINNSN